MQTRRRRWLVRLYALPAALALCLMLPKLEQGLFNVDTGWYAAIALQAWRGALGDGEWGHLWSLRGYGGTGEDGLPYFNKPPLAFWVHGLTMWLLGPTVFAARLPSVLAAAGAVLLTVAAVRELSGRKAALLAGIVLALTLEFTRHARSFSLDMWQAMFFAAAVWLAARAVARGRGRELAWAGVPIGLALMTKPLVGFVPLGILGVWLVWIGRWRWCGWLALAAVVAAVVAAPWHLSMAAIHGEAFTSRYFGHEIGGRAAGVIEGLNEGAGGGLYYFTELSRQFWPWLITAALAYIAWGRAQVGRLGGVWLGDGAKLAVVWSVVWLVLLSSFADKRPRYLLPVFPAWAWLSAVWLMSDAPRWVMIVRRAMERWALPAALVIAIVMAALPIRITRWREAHYDAVFARVRELGETRIWEGGRLDGAGGARGARAYFALGQWPRRARDPSGEVVAAPPAGALVMYHEIGGWGPGENEVVELRKGPLTLTRVGEGEWRPVRREQGVRR